MMSTGYQFGMSGQLGAEHQRRHEQFQTLAWAVLFLFSHSKAEQRELGNAGPVVK